MVLQYPGLISWSIPNLSKSHVDIILYLSGSPQLNSRLGVLNPGLTVISCCRLCSNILRPSSTNSSADELLWPMAEANRPLAIYIKMAQNTRLRIEMDLSFLVSHAFPRKGMVNKNDLVESNSHFSSSRSWQINCASWHSAVATLLSA